METESSKAVVVRDDPPLIESVKNAIRDLPAPSVQDEDALNSSESINSSPSPNTNKTVTKKSMSIKAPAAKHFTASPTSDVHDHALLVAEKTPAPKKESRWPKIPSFLLQSDIGKDDEIKVLLYMLGAKTDSLSVSRLQHLIYAFVHNEQKIQKAFSDMHAFDSDHVQKLVGNRQNLIDTLHFYLQNDDTKGKKSGNVISLK